MILSKPAAATSTLTTAWDFVAKNRKVIRYSLLAAAVWYYTRPAPKDKRKDAAAAAAAAAEESSAPGLKKVQGKAKIAVDRVLFQRLQRLMLILIPTWRSKEFGILTLHTFFLVFRTALSVYLAYVDGHIVGHLVNKDAKEFGRSILWWLVIAVPATYTNAMIKFLESKLALAFRSRLTMHLHKEYMAQMTYYKVGNLDDRVKNADQLITQDVYKFSTALAELWSNIAKPILDVTLYNAQLSNNVGFDGLMTVNVFIQASAVFLRYMTPAFGKMAAQEQMLEGEFRFAHARLIEHAEEVALYSGEKVEHGVLKQNYYKLIKHVNNIYHVRIWHTMLEDFIIKYYWGAAGMVITSLPIFFEVGSKDQRGSDMGKRTTGLVTNRRLLQSSADAFGRIMYSYKDLAELAGYTARVCELLDTFEDVKKGSYQKSSVQSGGKGDDAAARGLLSGRGEAEESNDLIRFENVPIVSPNGDILIKAMSFEVHHGDHLLIIGPNGCGKSSLFRILGGLWPVYAGKVIKPPMSQIFYLPQRPYLSLGTLRDQITYPDTKEQMAKRGVTDKDLMDILAIVELSNMVEREGGWDTVNSWQEVLSGGEKQRIAMARLFYHRPRYAILDECTSAVSMDIEHAMYTHATKLKISLLTVSHRPSLWKYHNLILQYDGQGGYVFDKLNAEERLALQEEKNKLELTLSELPKFQTRLSYLHSLVDPTASDAQDDD